MGKIDGKVDYEKAVYWFEKSAEQGNVIGQYNLGNMYENGEGVKQDYAEALKWYKKSAEQEYSKAQTNLGIMYANGYGVK